MKVIFVIDSISEIQNKMNMIKSRFGDNNVSIIVKAPFESLIKTFGYTPVAVYYNNLGKIMHMYLSACEPDNIIVYYSSMQITEALLNEFIAKITKNSSRLVNVVPRYNVGERMFTGLYNIYVKAMFKAKDSMASAKLQYVPIEYQKLLTESYFANRLFEMEEMKTSYMYVENKEISKTMKPKNTFSKFDLIPLILFLVITAGFITALGLIGLSYLMVATFCVFYIVLFIISFLFKCKNVFDKRFLK